MPYTRRQFFSGTTQALMDSIGRAAAKVRLPSSVQETQAQAQAQLPNVLRPPGALAEPAFLSACTRCTDCIEACPHQAIRRLGPEFGDRAATPAVIVDEAPCLLCDDLPCITSCTTGALTPTARQDVKMGTAVIDLQHCYQAMGQPCDYCVGRCPLKHEAIDWNEEGMPQINPDACPGCGVCRYICPAPGQPITIEPAEAICATTN